MPLPILQQVRQGPEQCTPILTLDPDHSCMHLSGFALPKSRQDITQATHPVHIKQKHAARPLLPA